MGFLQYLCLTWLFTVFRLTGRFGHVGYIGMDSAFVIVPHQEASQGTAGYRKSRLVNSRNH